MGREHVIDPSVIHHQWDAGLAPALEIDSGDVVHYDLKVAGEGQVWPGAGYEDTRFVPFPPHHGCGNIDNRHLPGALFSGGDPHAAQGDGEVSVTALEAPLSGSIRITLHKRRISTPRFRVPELSQPSGR